jgi:glycosyltransferase involved in cell wall biosynthesis
MHLVIVIPCLNEETSIGQVLSSIPETMDGVGRIDVVVVDDGSTDNTVKVASDLGAIVLSHKKNFGVGVAFHSGIDKAIELCADVVVNMDGDGQFNPRDIPRLVEPVLQGRADFVTASRFKDKALIPEMSRVKKWGNHGMSALISFLIGEKFYDVSCGFRAYSRETILRLNLMGEFTYTQESFLDIAFKNLKIVEIPLKIQGERKHGNSRVVKSIGNYAMNTAKIILRTFRDYKPLKFFGYISFFLFLSSCFLGLLFFNHYLQTGKFTQYLWAGFSSGFLLLFSLLFFVTGLLADMLDRVRQNQERLLYMEKKKNLEMRNQ